MVRRWKPPVIANIDAFEADLTAMHNKLLDYAHAIQTTSPQYAPLTELHSKLIETMQAVTGRDPPWVRNRYPGFTAELPGRK